MQYVPVLTWRSEDGVEVNQRPEINGEVMFISRPFSTRTGKPFVLVNTEGLAPDVCIELMREVNR